MNDPAAYDNQKKLTDLAKYGDPVAQLLRSMPWGQKEKLMDYGCAGGRITNESLLPVAIEHDSVILSVDISASMIEYANKTYPHPRVTYETANVMEDKFPVPDNYFHKIFTVHVLNWLPELGHVFQRFFDLLRPGGHFGLIVGCGGYFQSKVLDLVANDPKWASYMQGHEKFDYMRMYENPDLVKKTYRQIATTTGYQIIEMKVVNKGQDPIKMQGLVDFYVSLNPFLDRIPTDLRPQLQSDYNQYINQLLGNKEPKKGDDLVQHPHQILIGVLKKPEAKLPK